MRRPTLLVDLSRKAARQKLISDCRQWVLGSFVTAVAASCMPAGIYVKVFLWLLFIACGAYYVRVLKSPVVDTSSDSSSAPAFRHVPQPIVSNSMSTLASPSQTFSFNSTTTARLDTALRPLPASPEPPSLASYNLSDASHLADDVLRTRPASLEASRATPAPPIPSRVASTPSALSSALLGPAAALTPPPHRPPAAQPYQLSPLSLLQSPSAPPDRSAYLGVVKWGSLTLRVRDGLQALQLTTLREEWVEALRGLLGKHLLSLLRLFDEAVEEVTPWLVRALGAAQVPAEDQKRVLSLIDYSSETRFVRLSSTGQRVGMDEVWALCRQAAVPPDVVHRYHAATSFLRLCQQMAEGKGAPSDDAAARDDLPPSARSAGLWGWESGRPSPSFRLAAAGQSSQAGRRRPKSFVSRLKDMMFHSMDGRLRVQWPAVAGGDGGGGGRHAHVNSLSDQEIAVALFLHKCDSLAAWKPAFSSTSGKFSQLHYASSPRELHRIFSSLAAASASSSAPSPSPSPSLSSSSSTSSGVSPSLGGRAADWAEGWCIALVLQPGPAQASGPAGDGKDLLPSSSSSPSPSPSPSTSSGVSPSAQASPHVDVVWASLRPGPGPAPRDLLVVDRGRNDVFEAILVLLVALLVTYQYSDDDPRASSSSSSASPVVDYVVAKDVLRDVVGSDGLDALLAPLLGPGRQAAGAGAGERDGQAGDRQADDAGRPYPAGAAVQSSAFPSRSPAPAAAATFASHSFGPPGLLAPLAR